MATPVFTGSDKVNITINYNLGNPGGAQVGNVLASNSQSGQAQNQITDFTLSYGTGTVLDANGAVNVTGLYVYNSTLANATTKSVNMNGGSDVDFVSGAALVWSKLKYAFVANLGIVAGAPDGLLYLQVGPQGVTNAFNAAWGGSGATVWNYCPWSISLRGPAAGWTVTAVTAMLFPVNNPGATTLQILIILAGKT